MAGFGKELPGLPEEMDFLSLEEIPAAWTEHQDESDTSDEEEEDDYTQLRRAFNSAPGALAGLLTNVKEMNEKLLHLTLAIEMLSESLTATQGKVSLLQEIKQVEQDKTAYLYNCIVPRTYKLEQAMAHFAQVQKNPLQVPDSQATIKQQMKSLKEDALAVYSPDLLCHLAKREEMQYTSTSDRLIFLARRAHRLTEIRRVYSPDSNHWLEPRPLEPHLEASLRSLPHDTQLAKMEAFWKDIEKAYNEYPHLFTLFEMENKTLDLETPEERMAFIRHFIDSGSWARHELKRQSGTSALKRFMSFRKK